MNYQYIPGSGNNYNTGTASPNTNMPGFPYQPNTLQDYIPNPSSYAEDVLTSGKELYAQFFMSYPDSNQWKDSVFSGYIEASGKDYVVVRSATEKKWYLLWTVYLNYVVFGEDPMIPHGAGISENRVQNKNV